VVVIAWQLDLQRHVQSLPINPNDVSSNLVHGEVYSIQNWSVRLIYGDLRHFNQCFSYIVAVIVIGEGKRSTQRKSPTCSKSLINYFA
jgi:hypothetical protein